jgi:hypothetical protein
VALSVTALDLLPTAWTGAMRAGAVAFLVSGLLLALWSARETLSLIAHPRRPWLALAVAAAVAIALLILAGRTESLHRELAEEVGCALDRLASDPVAGFKTRCYLGYPTRQYYLAALPSALFGRSLFTLQAGGAIYFLIGLGLFVCGLHAFFGGDRTADAIAAATLLFFLHLRWSLYMTSHFEQSGFPEALALAFAGACLLYLSRHEASGVWLLALVLVHAASSYTPALSLAVGGIFVLAAIAFADRPSRPHRRALLLAMLLVAVEIAVSLTYRRDLRLVGNADSPGGFIVRLGSAARQLLLPDNDAPFADPLGLVGLWVSLGLALCGRLGRWAVGIAAWFLLTSLVASASYGTWLYSAELALHRSSVAIPALLVLFALALRRYFPTRLAAARAFRIALYLAALGAGIYQTSVLAHRYTDGSGALAWWIDRELSRRHEGPRPIAIDEAIDPFASHIFQFLHYFVPGAETSRHWRACDEAMPAHILVTRAGSPCDQQQRSQRAPAEFTFRGDRYSVFF